MNDHLFLIAIGGTGMRCLESFVHLCAAGLFDNQTIDILTLDTDQTNGNKTRVESLIGLYNDVKSSGQPGQPLSNNYFSARLRLYRFFTDYSTTSCSNFAAISATSGLIQQQKDDNQDLADLLFEKDTVQQFKLDHGYRAQTHLGSMLMYHGIIEAARNVKRGGARVQEQEKELAAFIKELTKNSASARVFVFGSVFGGTGASSIPIIPLAFSEAIRISSGGATTLNMSQVLFGSTLLTDYFSFANPNQQQLTKDKVVADSNVFALNSQAAMKFYDGDITTRNTYKRMYHIGVPAALKVAYSTTGTVATGGAEQCNPCHFAELMCACAAFDFFNADRKALAAIKTAQYLYRNVEVDPNGVLALTGAGFVGMQDEPLFEKKLGALLCLGHIVCSKFNGTGDMLNYFNAAKFTSYNYLTDTDCETVDKYLHEFLGWIYQLNASVGNGRFIFGSEAFRTQNVGDIDPGILYRDSIHYWDTKGVSFSTANRHWNYFMEVLKGVDMFPTDGQGTEPKEQLLGHLYNTINTANNF
ncbi:MAG: hypothetical protein ACI4AM_00625 [Muribaculaceae bacterium]